MPILIPILLCLLLNGCGISQTEVLETTVPVATVPVSREYGGREMDVHTLGEDVSTFLPVEGGWLLVTGDGNVTLLGDDLSVAATTRLEGADLQFWDTAEGIACYDAGRKQIRYLDEHLEENRRVTLPQNITTAPAISSDGSRICYAIPGALYRWDLTTGIRQRIQELDTDDLTLVGFQWEDRLLQCYRAGESLFLDAEDGRLVASHSGEMKLITQGEEYYAVFPSGLRNTMAFSTASGEITGLYPEKLSAEGCFLPGSGLAVTRSGQELTVYDLESGVLRDRLTLEEGHKLLSLHSAPEGRVLLLVDSGRETLCLRWEPEQPAAGTSYRAVYFPDDAQDAAELALCRAYAEELGERYGITICFGREAAARAPWDYRFEAEYQTPVILRILTEWKDCLSQFPEAVLQETAGQFDSLTICLVRTIAGTTESSSLDLATGVEYLLGKDAYVAIAASDYAARSLCHELFHGMETRILSTSNALDDWDKHNPSGFAYSLDYGSTADRSVYLSGGHRAFIDHYSMTYPKEDRARIFEYAMLPGQEAVFASETMQEKLRAICTGIREAYGLKPYEGALLWEQYLEN